MEATITGTRYQISDTIRDALPQEQKAYMEDLDRFFTQHNALSNALAGIKGVSAGNMLSVLRIISNATLGWCKPYERLYVDDFLGNRDASGTRITPMSRRTALRAIKALSDNDLIMRFSASGGKIVYYALNVRRIFERIESGFCDTQCTCSKSDILFNMWEKLSTSPCCSALSELVSEFCGRVSVSLESAKEILSNWGAKAMAGLEAGLRAVKKKAEEVSAGKERAKASEPFFDKNGKANPAAALALWHKEVKDTEAYPSHVTTRTGRAMGMMKHYLNECARNGYSEEEIREHFKRYARHWQYVSDKDRSITATSSRGKSYEVRMAESPDFEFFFAHRAEMSAKLMRAYEPGKLPDGSERPAVDSLWFTA